MVSVVVASAGASPDPSAWSSAPPDLAMQHKHIGVYKATTFSFLVLCTYMLIPDRHRLSYLCKLNNINLLQFHMHTIPFHLIPGFTALQRRWHRLPNHCRSNSYTLSKIRFLLLLTTKSCASCIGWLKKIQKLQFDNSILMPKNCERKLNSLVQRDPN